MKIIYKITILLLIFSGGASYSFAQKLQVKILCWNIRAFEGDENKPEEIFKLEPFIKFIKKHNPDIIGIQELETHTSRQNSKELMTALAAELGMYPQFGFSYIADEGSDGLYGNGILSKFPIMSTHSEEIPWQRNQADPRSVQWADILVPHGEQTTTIRIINTHIDHKTSGRSASMRWLRTNFCETTDLPALVMGDLNEGVWGSFYKDQIAAHFNLFDPALWPDKTDNVGGHLTTFIGNKLDYVLGYPKGTWTPISYDVDYSSGNLSDHYPIIVTLELNK